MIAKSQEYIEDTTWQRESPQYISTGYLYSLLRWAVLYPLL